LSPTPAAWARVRREVSRSPLPRWQRGGAAVALSARQLRRSVFETLLLHEDARLRRRRVHYQRPLEVPAPSLVRQRPA
jgi:hypothetical protein